MSYEPMTNKPSPIERTLRGYRVSRDYEALWRLAHSQSVVCVVDYNFRPTDTRPPCRDVCQTITWKNGDGVACAARGMTYVESDQRSEFISQCKKANLEFLVPAGRIAELVLDVGKRSLDDQDRFLTLLCTLIGPRAGSLKIARDVCRGVLYMLATEEEVAKAHAAAFGEQDRIENGPKQ